MSNITNNEKILLESEIAYLRGKIEVYENFLRSQGFIKGGEE